MTSVPRAVLTVRSYRSVSWWTRTAVTVSAWALPDLVLTALTLSPTFSREVGIAFPEASSTPVAAVNDWPPHDDLGLLAERVVRVRGGVTGAVGASGLLPGRVIGVLGGRSV